MAAVLDSQMVELMGQTKVAQLANQVAAMKVGARVGQLARLLAVPMVERTAASLAD